MGTTDNGALTKRGESRKRFYLDITGRRCGDLEVLGKSGNVRGNNVLWLCYCHACGTKKEIVANQLRSYTKSCGCKRTQRDWHSPGWQGVGEISRMKLTGLRSGALKRRIHYDLKDEYIWQLFLCQERKCALSGLPLKFRRGPRDGGTTASLDRIESDKPYIVGNVQWVHKHINAMKLNHKEEYFISLCKIVVDFNAVGK